MTAYPENELYNYHVRSQAQSAFELGDISKESYKKVEEAYPCKLYTPHFFISVALGLLTIIATFFTGILAWLFTRVESSFGIALLCAFMAFLCYFLLEWMVKRKSYFNAGIDNALMVLILLFSGGVFFSYSEEIPWILFNTFLMLIALWLCLRFTDAFMAIVSAGFFLVVCFLLYLKSGENAVAYFPFVMMLIIAALYFLINKTKNSVKFIYEKCLIVLTVFLLLAFYATGNYWVVKELQSSLTAEVSSIGPAWIFWIFTFSVPIIYIVYGIIKKDLLHLRTGLVLVAITVLTYKYYYTLLPIEIEMLLVGLLLTAVSYFFIKWLKTSRYGYTSESISARSAWKNVEALIISETMGAYLKPLTII